MELNKNEIPQTERRRFPRLNASVAVEYSIIEKNPFKEITFTKSISSGGICLIVYEEIEVDTTLSLKINLTDDNDFIEAKGRVVWSSEFSLDPDKNKRWDLGIEFLEASEDDRKRVSKYVFTLLR